MGKLIDKVCLVKNNLRISIPPLGQVPDFGFKNLGSSFKFHVYRKMNLKNLKTSKNIPPTHNDTFLCRCKCSHGDGKTKLNAVLKFAEQTGIKTAV